MSKGHRIVYSSSGSSSGSSAVGRKPAARLSAEREVSGNSGSTASSSRLQFRRPLSLQGQRSPRKRMRQPSPLKKEPAKVPKLTGHGHNFDDDGDDLDLLGLAAVEQYEATQRQRSTSPSCVSAPPKELTPPQGIPVSHPIQTGLTSPVNVMDTPFVVKTTKCSTPPITSVSNFPSKPPLPSSTSTAPPPSNGTTKGLEDRIRNLQEQNYNKDGEVKVLRGEKERLQGELRKMAEQMNQIRMQYIAENKAREKELMKEKTSLETKIQFKEQEVVSLREQLEKRSQGGASTSPGSVRPNRSSRRSSLSASESASARKKGASIKPGGCSDGKPTEFLSTENFLPLSQLSSDSGVMSVSPVMGVAVHHPRDAASGRAAAGSRSSSSSSSKTQKSSRSRSISPHSMDLKKMKKRSVSDRGESSNARQKSVASVKSSPSSASERGSSCTSEEVAVETGACSHSVCVPGRELDGAQILTLLTNLNLLRPPFNLIRHQTPPPSSSTSSSVVTASSQDSYSSASSISTTSSSSESVSLEHQIKTERYDKISGLLSLLPQGGGVASSSYSTAPKYSTPQAMREDTTLRSSSDHSPMTTPTRHAHPIKPHTIARTNLAQLRVRRNSGLLTSNKKAFSTSNTPVKAAPPISSSDSTSSLLLSSIDANSLQRNISNLLSSSEVVRFTSFSPRLRKGKPFHFSSSSSSVKGFSPGESSATEVMEILKQVSHLIVNYHQELSNKAKAAAISHSSENSSESMDSSYAPSPRTSSAGSRSSGPDLISPILGDQLLVVQALEILEVLVTYSRRVREQILVQPPAFVIDSRPTSSLDVHPSMPSLNVSLEVMEGVESGGATPSGLLAEASHRLESLQQQDREAFANKQEQDTVVRWKNRELVSVALPSSGKVWMAGTGGGSGSTTRGEVALSGDSHMQVTSTGWSGCGHLFSVLLDLPMPPWKQSSEIAILCFKILTSLAETCPQESLHRFGQLLQKERETILLCLEKEDPPLTLSILCLLTFLASSEEIVGMLCTRLNPGEPCLLLMCYQALLYPPASLAGSEVHKIQLQVVEFVSRLAVSAGGPAALYEKCTCSHELLSAIVSLLERMVEGVNHISQWSKLELCLVCQAVSLVFRISVSDQYFDLHRDRCERGYMVAFSRLAVLLKSGQQESQQGICVGAMVGELFSYCEDLEDSHDMT